MIVSKIIKVNYLKCDIYILGILRYQALQTINAANAPCNRVPVKT